MTEIVGGIGVRIAGDAGQFERELAEAVAATRAAAAQIAAAMGGLSARLREEMDRTEQGVRRSTQRIGGFYGGMVGSVAGQMAAFAAITAGISAGVSFARTTGDFQQTFALIEAESGIAGAALERLRTQAIQLGTTTAVAANDVATMVRELAKAGRTSAEIENIVPALTNFSIAADLGAEEAAEFANALVNQFNVPANRMVETLDMIAAAAAASSADVDELVYSFRYVGAIANAAGYDIRDTAAALSLLSDAGITGSMAGTTLRSVINDLTAPTMRGAAAMRALGFQTTTATGEMRPLRDILQDIRDRGLTIGDLFRMGFEVDSAQGLVAMSNMLERLPQIYGAIDQAAGAADRMSSARMAGLTGAVRNLSNEWEAFLLRLGDEGALQGLTNVINGLAEGVNQASEFTGAVSDLSAAISTGPEFGWIGEFIDWSVRAWQVTIGWYQDYMNLWGAMLRGVFPGVAQRYDAARAQRAQDQQAAANQQPMPVTPRAARPRTGGNRVPQRMLGGGGESFAAQQRRERTELEALAAASERGIDAYEALAAAQQLVNQARQSGTQLTLDAAMAQVQETAAIQAGIRARLEGQVSWEEFNQDYDSWLDELAQGQRDFTTEIARTAAEQDELTAAARESVEAYERLLIVFDLMRRNPELGRDAAEGMAAQIRTQNVALDRAVERMRDLQQAAEDMGTTIASAFEDAIFSGRSFGDVLRGLALDIARIAFRTAITNPLGQSLGNMFSGLFGGGKAIGGPVAAGTGYLVGEKGPELFMPSLPGAIVPNHQIASMGLGGAPMIIDARATIDARGADPAAIDRLRAGLARRDAELPGRIRAVIGDMRQRGRV